MRIALLHPTCWPEVRQGPERILGDLAAGLAGRGHDVCVLSFHAGARRIAEEAPGLTVDRGRRPPYMRPLRWYEDAAAEIPSLASRLRAGRFDVAHALAPAAAVAAQLARTRLGGPPFVASLPVLPARSWLVERRYRMQMLESVIAAAAAVTAPSEGAAELYRRYLMTTPQTVPFGVPLAEFAADAEREQPPVLLCAESLAGPDGAGGLLLEAFARVRAERPESELVIVRPNDPLTRAWEAPDRPDGVRRAEAPDRERLAALYASASATVIPRGDLGFGLTAVESLASGTPVAAASGGALEEVVADEAVGRLFDAADPANAAAAIAAALDLAGAEKTRDRCRAAVTGFDLERSLDAFERIYEAAT